MQDRRERSSQFALFLCAGALATCFALVMRAFINLMLDYEVSVAIGHLCGMVLAFYLNARFVFQVDAAPAATFARFVVVNLIGLVITMAVSSLLYRGALSSAQWLPWPGLVAHGVGVLVATVPTFLLHAAFSFRPTAQP